MAYHTVEDGPWPVGTTVTAYLTSALVGGLPAGPPVSSGVASANGVVEFGALTEGSTYTAFGHGGSQQFVATNQEDRLEALEGGRSWIGSPGGVDDTAAISAAFTALGRHGGVGLAVGVWRAKLGTLGSTTAGQGVNYSLKGAGPTKTILAPVDNTAGILKIIGPGDASSDFFELDDIGICLPFDMDYALPLIEVAINKGMLRVGKNVRFYAGDPASPNSVADYTGTFLKLDGAYEGEVMSEFRTRKYAVPMEFVNTTSAASLGVPPNLDTLRVGGTINGVCGHIFRDAYSQIHGLTFDGYKLTHTVNYAVPPYGEATIATGGASAAASSVKVNTAMVAGTMPVVGDAISVDYGNLLEIAKVTSVTDNGDGTTSLGVSKPLRFSHVAARPVFIGGACLSFGNGYTAVDLRGFHFEGPLIGVRAGNVRGLNLHSGYANVGELVRMEGETRAVFFGKGIESWGTPNRHVGLIKAVYNAAVAGTFGDHLIHEFNDPITLPGYFITPTMINNTGNDWVLHKRNRSAGTGAQQSVWNSNANVADRDTHALSVQVSGAEKAFIAHHGRAQFLAVNLQDVGNTSGLTAAQIDTLVNTLLTSSGSPGTSPLSSGLTVHDHTNKRSLVRVGTSWYPIAWGTAIT